MVTMTTESEKDKAATTVLSKKMGGSSQAGNQDAPNILVYKKVRFILTILENLVLHFFFFILNFG